MEVAIVDYGMGNIDSVSRAVELCGGRSIVTSVREDLESADYIIIPGVGSFKHGIERIRHSGIDKILNNQVKEKIPILGICLGMQLLSSKGFEGGEQRGLGLIEGQVKLMESCNENENLPHIGWNEVDYVHNCPLFLDIPSGKDFYFVHSYHFDCVNNENVMASTSYCGKFSSVIQKDNIFGVQFHPEKSQRFGLMLLENFLMI